MDRPHAELSWLKKEYHLTDAQFAQVVKLHDAYRPQCAEMCRRIDQHNRQANELLQSTNQMTPQIESFLLAGAQLRAECQRDMLRHFYAVAGQMPPAQAHRYLEWVCRETSITDASMRMSQ